MIGKVNSHIGIQSFKKETSKNPAVKQEYYHSTTVSQAKKILNEGKLSRDDFYITPSLLQARSYGIVHSLKEKFKTHKEGDNQEVCTLRLTPLEDVRLIFYRPRLINTRFSSTVSKPNPNTLEIVDHFTDGKHIYLTRNGFQKFYIEPVDPKVLDENRKCFGCF